MARLERDEVQAIKDYHEVDDIYSWSQIQKMRNDKYSMYLQKIKREPEDIGNWSV